LPINSIVFCNGVDGDGVIVGQRLTGASVDDGNVGVDFVDHVPGKIRSVTGDGACDSRALYDAAIDRGAKVVVPPVKTAQTGGRAGRVRDRVVKRIRKVGRRQWKKECGYHRQSRAENTFMRYKKILGDRLHARHTDAQSGRGSACAQHPQPHGRTWNADFVRG
tara:strand:- start:3233 stop:3724 length:492 start_codon:yes stop_codon:yes gene_type:complete